MDIAKEWVASRRGALDGQPSQKSLSRCLRNSGMFAVAFNRRAVLSVSSRGAQLKDVVIPAKIAGPLEPMHLVSGYAIGPLAGGMMVAIHMDGPPPKLAVDAQREKQRGRSRSHSRSRRDLSSRSRGSSRSSSRSRSRDGRRPCRGSKSSSRRRSASPDAALEARAREYLRQNEGNRSVQWHCKCEPFHHALRHSS